MKVQIYKAGASPAARAALKTIAYHRLAVRHNLDTANYWAGVAQEEAGRLIATGCEPQVPAQPSPLRDPVEYLSGVVLAASGLPVIKR